MTIDYITEPFEDSDNRGYRGPGYYFWDETQVYCYGPYEFPLQAHQAHWDYCKEVLGHVTTDRPQTT